MNATRDPDPHVLYTVVRRSLNLPIGKAVAQGQHAIDYLLREVERIATAATDEEMDLLDVFLRWRWDKDHAKVVLGATDEEFEEVKQTYRHFLVVDLGYTVVAPNTETCLCLWPMRKSARSKLLKSLKLL